VTDGVDATELSPGVHRVEAVRDGKLFGLHVLETGEGVTLVDAGYRTAPEAVYEPFLASEGRSLAGVSAILVTHADVDHHGGTCRVRERSPTATVLAHAADAPLVGSNDELLRRRYRRFEDDHGLGYDDATLASIRDQVGPAVPVDVCLRGGEAIRVRDRTLDVLHTPGHSAGHLALWDPAHDLLVGADAFFGRGVRGVDGSRVQPPPYYQYPEYRATVRRVADLDPATVSCTHYPVMRGGTVDEFVRESLAFVDDLDALCAALLADRPRVELADAVAAAVDRLGSAGRDVDYAIPLAAHFADLVRRDEAAVLTDGERTAWTAAGSGGSGDG
jgi:glyoxylase-like metal-dependent hydrolase (beta-lactamase superfamily II)